MIFAIQPTMLTLGGDVLSAALDQASGGKIPVFGTCAIDMAQKIRCPQIMYQGRAYGDRMALLFFKGPVQPRFFASLFPEQFFLTQDAVITGVSGTRITTINNIPAASFLEDLGLLQGGPVKITSAIPLVIHYIDGSSRQVVILSDITPEGAVISNRNVRVGGELKLGAITADHILESVRVLVRDIKQNGNGAGLFMFSCFMRTVATGGNSMAEIGEIQKEFAGFPQPYILCYSGGELCPQYTEAGGMRNRFYQYALIACQL
jgi:hypothetical protein